jgi:thiamine-phosphate pyrophosphorylase
LTPPRFYPILDTALLAQRQIPLAEAAEAILEGGARILQFRHKGHFSRDVFRCAEHVSELCHLAGALFVMNDRVDAAMLLGAAVHLGQDDLPCGEARRLLPSGHAIGFSTHNETQLREAALEPADYLALGPVFATGSKENPDPVLGVERFRQLRKLTPRPLVAIGGITPGRAIELLEAGADSLAVIGGLYPQEFSKPALRARTEEWVQLLEK